MRRRNGENGCMGLVRIDTAPVENMWPKAKGTMPQVTDNANKQQLAAAIRSSRFELFHRSSWTRTNTRTGSPGAASPLLNGQPSKGVGLYKVHDVPTTTAAHVRPWRR